MLTRENVIYALAFIFGSGAAIKIGIDSASPPQMVVTQHVKMGPLTFKFPVSEGFKLFDLREDSFCISMEQESTYSIENNGDTDLIYFVAIGEYDGEDPIPAIITSKEVLSQKHIGCGLKFKFIFSPHKQDLEFRL